MNKALKNERLKIAALLVGLVSGSVCIGAAQSALLSGFEPEDGYQLEIDGVVDEEAQLFLQRRLPAFLVLPSGSNTPWMLSIRSRAVQSVNIMKMTAGPTGTMDLSPDAVMGTKATLEQDGGSFSFFLDGKRYQVVEKPDLLGLVRGSRLEEYAANYRDGSAAYTPDEQAMDTIRSAKGKVHVRVYFGSWCPHCQRHVPHVVRIEKDIQRPNITIDFYGLPRGISSDPVAGQAKINSVPTAVVFVDGKEIGRLSNNDWRSPEKALAKLLKGR